MLNPAAPWHMWGNQIELDVPGASPATVPEVVSSQLLKVQYRRPETWSFWFAAQPAELEVGAPSMILLIDLIIGVGRTHMNTMDQRPSTVFTAADVQAFVKMRWVGGAAITHPPVRWTTRGYALSMDDTDATLAQPVDWFPAQDIQVYARAFNTQTGQPKRVTVWGFVAPRTHVRPDWFVEAFRGGETGGT